MEGSFHKKKKHEFVLWDKGNEEMEDKIEIKNRLKDDDNDGYYELEDILMESQSKYLDVISVVNLTETEDDMQIF